LKVRMSKKLILVGALLILSSSMVTYALTTLFSQSFPSQTFATPLLVQGPKCSGGNLVLDPSAGFVPTYASGLALLVYGCDSSGDAAFYQQGTGSFAAVPTFTLPTGWIVLSIDTTTDPSGLCEGTTVEPLTSGTGVTVIGGSSYVYCLSTNPATSFSTFSISWAE